MFSRIRNEILVQQSNLSSFVRAITLYYKGTDHQVPFRSLRQVKCFFKLENKNLDSVLEFSGGLIIWTLQQST